MYRNLDGHECHCHLEHPEDSNSEVTGWMFHQHTPKSDMDDNMEFMPNSSLESELASYLSIMHPSNNKKDMYNSGETVQEADMHERDDDNILPCTKCKYVGKVAADGRCPSCGELLDDPRPIFAASEEAEKLIDSYLNGVFEDEKSSPRLKITGVKQPTITGKGIELPQVIKDIPREIAQKMGYTSKKYGTAIPSDPSPVSRYIRQTTGGMSDTTKLPGMSYGLPPRHCITGSKLSKVPGSVCSKCYAKTGMYVFNKRTGETQEGRYKSVVKAMSHPKHADRWVNAMTAAINLSTPKHDPHFRWHDSGDLQGVEHLRLISRVAEQTPHIEHWLPTKEHGMVRDYKKKYGEFPKNLAVRMSSAMLDAPPPKTGFHDLTSTVSTTPHPEHEGFKCPAYKTGGGCGSCRECWSSKQKNIIYPYHRARHHTEWE